MEKKTYIPISCSFYDELEAIATFRKKVMIKYFDEENNEQEVQDLIQTFTTKDKVEYMVLQSGSTIRLDYLISVDGKALPTHC